MLELSMLNAFRYVLSHKSCNWLIEKTIDNANDDDTSSVRNASHDSQVISRGRNSGISSPCLETFSIIGLTFAKCSAQEQVLHCKLRRQGCNSAQRQVFHCKLRNLGCSFTRDWICAVASRCFPTPLSLFSIWTNLKKSEKIPGAPTRWWGKWIWLTGPSGLHRNSPQGLNITSIRVSDQIRDPDIPITLRSYLSY